MVTLCFRQNYNDYLPSVLTWIIEIKIRKRVFVNKKKYFYSILLISVPVLILIVALLKLGEISSPIVAALVAIAIVLGLIPLLDLKRAFWGTIISGILFTCAGGAIILPINILANSKSEATQLISQTALYYCVGSGMLIGGVWGGVRGADKRLKKLMSEDARK